MGEFGVTTDEKIIAVFKTMRGAGKMSIYDDNGPREMPYNEWKTDRKKCRSSKYKYIECFRKMTLQETRDILIKGADELKLKTNGMINLYKTGSFPQTARNIFNKTNKFLYGSMERISGKKQRQVFK